MEKTFLKLDKTELTPIGTEKEEKITEKQRRYIFVLVRNYADLTKYTPEEARDILTTIYCCENHLLPFSLSDCSQERASDFIEFLLRYTEEWKK